MKEDLAAKISYLLNFISTVSVYWSERSNHYRFSKLMAEKESSDLYAAAWVDLAQSLYLLIENDDGNLLEYIKAMKTYLEDPDYVPPTQHRPLLYWCESMNVFRHLKETKSNIDYDLLKSMMLSVFSNILEPTDQT